MKELGRDGHRSDVPTLEPCLRVTRLCKLNGQACETGAPEGVSRVRTMEHGDPVQHSQASDIPDSSKAAASTPAPTTAPTT